MSDEDTMDWDEEPIDWESLFAEVTETNEANSDSVATLELSEIAPSVFDAMHKALDRPRTARFEPSCGARARRRPFSVRNVLSLRPASTPMSTRMAGDAQCARRGGY